MQDVYVDNITMKDVILTLIPLLSFILGLFLGRFFASSNPHSKIFRDVFNVKKEPDPEELSKMFKVVSPSKKLQEKKLERELEEEQ